MTSSVRVLTTASLDSSPSLLLVAPDGSKVLINCGEGCQRAFIEFSQKVASVQAVCLTEISHDTVGGLPGFLLTTSDVQAAMEGQKISVENEIIIPDSGGPNGITGNLRPRPPRWPFCPITAEETAHLHLFGPRGSCAYVEALRHFTRRDKYKLRVYEGGNCQAVPAVPLSPPQKSKKKTAQPEHVRFAVTTLPFEEPLTEPSEHPAGRKRPRENSSRQTLSFLFTTPPIVGKFLPNMAQELGVPRGPMFAELKAGKSVTFIHPKTNVEITVLSEQVVTPSSPGLAVLVLRYPETPDNLDSFFSSLAIADRLAPTKAQLNLVIHIASASTLASMAAKRWRETQLHEQVEQLWMDTNAQGETPHRSAAVSANIRAQLCPDIFQPLYLPSIGTKNPSHDTSFTLGRVGMEYVLLPCSKQGFVMETDWSTGDTQETKQKEMEESGALELARTIMNQTINPVFQASQQPLATELTPDLLFMGTASALPCKYRNVTGMLLSNSDGRAMLLDVGEGTVGQLLRMQPSEPDVAELLSKITVVWISHPHADHHLGLLRLLEQRPTSSPLLVIAPPPIFRFLQEYAAGVDSRIARTYRSLECRAFVNKNPVAVAELKDAIGFTNCRAVQVEHCPYSYALIVDGTPFGRVVYSGDCRPSKDLVAAAKPADLLIHECTFEDGMESEAFLKRHCTIGEALTVAKNMEARFTVLTHFSQRYPRIPPPTQVIDTRDMPIIFAFDFQRLTPGTLHLASQLTPALRKLYPAEDATVMTDQENVESVAQQVLATPGLFAQSKLL